MSERTLANLTREDWAAHEGSVFTLEVDPATRVELTLLSAVSRSGAMPFQQGARVPYRLRFRATARDLALPQRIYALSHPVFGKWDVFLVPIGPDEVGMRLDAEFS